MKDRLLLKDLVPGKPSTWNRHALTYVYWPNDDFSEVPVELVYPDESVLVGCKARPSTSTPNAANDNSDLLDTAGNSAFVVFASKHVECDHAFWTYKELSILIATYIAYVMILFVLYLISGYEKFDTYEGIVFKCLNLFSQFLCIAFLAKRTNLLLLFHTILSNIIFCISSVHIKTVPQILAMILQAMICYYSVRTLKKESSHVFFTRNVA